MCKKKRVRQNIGFCNTPIACRESVSDVIDRLGLAAAGGAVAGIQNRHGFESIFQRDGLTAFKKFDDLFQEHAVEGNTAGDFGKLEGAGLSMTDTGTVFPVGA